MFRYFRPLLMLCTVVVAGPISCKEDAHCSEGYYCEAQDKMCYQCLQCEDFNRLMPLLQSLEFCVKSIYQCGPCFEGYVNIYETYSKGICVLPELLGKEKSPPFCFYIWMTAGIAGSLIVIIFVYVIWNTYVYQVSSYYNPIPTITPASIQWTAENKLFNEDNNESDFILQNDREILISSP